MILYQVVLKNFTCLLEAVLSEMSQETHLTWPYLPYNFILADGRQFCTSEEGCIDMIPLFAIVSLHQVKSDFVFMMNSNTTVFR